jgi:DNA-binding IclR family transcriptional regulator
VDNQSEKVLSAMPQGKLKHLSEISALSGMSQNRALRILHALEAAGVVKRKQPDKEPQPSWMRV